MVMLAVALACSAGAPSDETLKTQDNIPTPDRSQVQIIDRELPAGLTDPAASAAYDQGYLHMLDAAWFAAIAAYDEAIRIQPEVRRTIRSQGHRVYVRRPARRRTGGLQSRHRTKLKPR